MSVIRNVITDLRTKIDTKLKSMDLQKEFSKILQTELSQRCEQRSYVYHVIKINNFSLKVFKYVSEWRCVYGGILVQ